MKRVLISGGGVAGPALAWWLHRVGIECTVVETAPALRQGGQAVDFRGPVHRDVLERMGLWQEIHARRTPAAALDVLTADGRALTTLPAYMFSGDVEITRGDLSTLLFERTRAFTDYRFADRITALHDTTANRWKCNSKRRAPNPSIWWLAPTACIPACAPSTSAPRQNFSATKATASPAST